MAAVPKAEGNSSDRLLFLAVSCPCRSRLVHSAFLMNHVWIQVGTLRFVGGNPEEGGAS